jgi:hypothetical protein
VLKTAARLLPAVDEMAMHTRIVRVRGTKIPQTPLQKNVAECMRDVFGGQSMCTRLVVHASR